MKLKPLLKSHWVASQNPMNVSLAGLKCVVFTPPPSLLSFEFHSDATTIRQLCPLSELRILAPEVGEARDVSHKTYALTRDLFWGHYSNLQMNYFGGPSQALKDLANSLEFIFEDGSTYALPGIFRKEGFPRFLDPFYYIQDRSCNWEKALGESAARLLEPLKITAQQKRTEDFKRVWIAILEILAWAFQRKRQIGDLEILYCENPTDENRQAHVINDIEFSKALPLVATITNEAHQAQLRLWQGYEATLPIGILRLHSAETLAALEIFLRGNVAKNVMLATDGARDFKEVPAAERALLAPVESFGTWKPALMAVESNTENFLKSLTRLEETIGEKNIFFAERALVQDSQFKPVLKVREREGSLEISTSFLLPDQQLEFLNLPSSFSTALAPFFGGIDTFLGVDRKQVSSRLNQYRNNDMLFLRHQGVALFCLFELCNWILGKPLSSGKQIQFIEDTTTPEADQQFEKLLTYLKESIPALLGKAPTSFAELFSGKVQNLFIDFLEPLYQSLLQDRSLAFFKEQFIEVKNVKKQTLPLLRFLILHFIETSRGKFLTRTQVTLGETLSQGLDGWTKSSLVPLVPAGPSTPPNRLELPRLWLDLGVFNKYSISLLFELIDQGIDVELNGVSLANQTNPFEFSFSVKDSTLTEDVNWFDLHPQIFFNGTRVAPEEVKINFGQGEVGFIEYQGQVYRIDKAQLPSLKSLERFWKRITSSRETVTRNSFGEKVYRLEKSQALELLMLKSQGIEVKVEGEWKKIFDYFTTGLGVDKIQLSNEMSGTLLPYQFEGAQWLHDLYELKLGAILADEMGLGKTFQVLAFLMSLQQRNELGRSLVVVPTSLVYNWVDEKKKFAPELNVRIFQPFEKNEIKELIAKKEPIVLVATYGLLMEHSEFFQGFNWNVVVFDEAQNLKNITSQRSVAARQLLARFKICVTGTPMENNYLEYFSLCDLVIPGCLGDIDEFRKQYYNREVRLDALKELKLISKPLLLRRTKQQVKLSLPTKTINKVTLPFGPQQKEIYKKMAMTFSRQVEELINDQGERKAQIAMFAALMRLRQICSDPAAVPGVNYTEQPVKIEHFLSSLQEHLEGQESVVVFTQFLSTLNRLEGELIKAKVPVFTLQGSVSSKERLRLISAFQESAEPGVMLMTLKTGGVGLNLTKASVVYHLEPWWNPAVENQATDRAHRMGQKKDVKVYNLLIEGSLEERIADLKVKKQDSFDRLFAVEESLEETSLPASGALTREDFIFLLK
jgi:superfamily II DNA or RNA helicase